MIDEDTARAVAARYLETDEFELREFGEGWRVIRNNPPANTRGGGSMVVERSSGKLLRFASGIAPRVIYERFSEVRTEAFELN